MAMGASPEGGFSWDQTSVADDEEGRRGEKREFWERGRKRAREKRVEGGNDEQPK